MDPLLQGYLSLSRDVNKTNENYQEEHQEGVVSDLTEELKLSMPDEELIELKNDWIAAWAPFEKNLAISQSDNENYWLGKQYDHETKQSSHSLVDNQIFTSLETFLPIATRPKADPIVTGDNTQEGEALANKVRKMLTYWVDNVAYNLKLKQVARFWALYKLGVMKIGWSNQMNDITVLAIRPQKLILDPDSIIDNAEYTGEYIGEYRKDTARNLVKRFPQAKKYIEDQAKDKMGTKMQYIEWWTDDYVFWTMDNEVLAKAKNPHWNYQSSQKIINEVGEEKVSKIDGKNHFPYPKKPYIMLSIFSLGRRPYDETNLIQQSLPLQDLINKRLRQIDKNADRTNGGLAVSGDAFTKEQAAGIGKATERGGTIFVPNGNVNNAVARLSAPALPSFVYESLIDYRTELLNIFGTRGSSPEGTIGERTVRGKMLIKGQDGDRIGGGVSTYLEQFSDVVFNWVTQMFYVYYDQPHIASIIGKNRAQEYLSLRSSDLICKLSVSVKDGSMIPKDPVSQREEVVELWGAGAIDPITFFEKLDFPDPKMAAQQLYIWKADPGLLFPEVAQQIAAKAQAQVQPMPVRKPSESLNYKDAPDSIKRQIEQQAGLIPASDPATDPVHEKLISQSFAHTHEHQKIQHEAINMLELARAKNLNDQLAQKVGLPQPINQ